MVPLPPSPVKNNGPSNVHQTHVASGKFWDVCDEYRKGAAKLVSGEKRMLLTIYTAKPVR